MSAIETVVPLARTEADALLEREICAVPGRRRHGGGQ